MGTGDAHVTIQLEPIVVMWRLSGKKPNVSESPHFFRGQNLDCVKYTDLKKNTSAMSVYCDPFGEAYPLLNGEFPTPFF